MRCPLVVAVGFLLGLSSCSVLGGQQTLEVFAQSGLSIAHGDPGGITYTFTFDQEGLIRSYKEVGSTGIVLRSFEVRRDGEEITPAYVKNNLSSWVRSLQIVAGSLSLKTSKMGEGDALEVRPIETTEFDGESFEHVYNGKTSVVFGFGAGQTRLEYPLRSETFEFRWGNDGQTPAVAAAAAEADTYETVARSSGQFDVTVKAADGLVLAKYRIKGLPRRCDPLIAIANFEMFTGGPDLSPVFFPFIGGAPK